jgi:hypothetical protein
MMTTSAIEPLCDPMPIGAYRAALDGRLLCVNSAFVQMPGFTSAQEVLRDCGSHARCYALAMMQCAQFIAKLYVGDALDFDSVMLRQGEHAGVDDCLSKPFKPTALAEALEQAANQRIAKKCQHEFA